MKLRPILKFENSVWCCDLALPGIGNIELHIFSPKEKLDVGMLELAEVLVDSLDGLHSKSVMHAKQSVYKSDIDYEGGLTPVALQVVNEHDYRYWFTLGKSIRQLAVNYNKGILYDLYCESP